MNILQGVILQGTCMLLCSDEFISLAIARINNKHNTLFGINIRNTRSCVLEQENLRWDFHRHQGLRRTRKRPGIWAFWKQTIWCVHQKRHQDCVLMQEKPQMSCATSRYLGLWFTSYWPGVVAFEKQAIIWCVHNKVPGVVRLCRRNLTWDAGKTAREIVFFCKRNLTWDVQQSGIRGCGLGEKDHHIECTSPKTMTGSVEVLRVELNHWPWWCTSIALPIWATEDSHALDWISFKMEAARGLLCEIVTVNKSPGRGVSLRVIHDPLLGFSLPPWQL